MKAFNKPDRKNAGMNNDIINVFNGTTNQNAHVDDDDNVDNHTYSFLLVPDYWKMEALW